MNHAHAIISANHDPEEHPPVMDILAHQLREAGIKGELHTSHRHEQPTGWLADYKHRTVLLVELDDADRALAILYPQRRQSA